MASLAGRQNADKMEKEKLEKKLVEKQLALIAMTRSAVDLETTLNVLETDESLLMKSNKEQFSCLSQMSTSRGRSMDSLLKVIAQFSVRLVFNV